MEHNLGLEIIDTNNEKVLKIIDGSIYAEDVPIVCPKLEITAPGFQFSSTREVTRDFNLSLTACNLEIQVSNCDSRLNDLPDGLYAIKYKITPYEYVYVEINHLRLTKVHNRIEKLYCDLGIPTSDIPKKKKEKLDKINEVENYLKAAKSSVESCQNSKYGMELYNYALKLLDRIDCKNC